LIQDTQQYFEQLRRSREIDGVAICQPEPPDPRLLDAWNRFHRRYDPLIRRYIRYSFVPPSEFEDAVQACWCELFVALCHFDPSPERGKFRQWLMGVVYLTVAPENRSRLRRERRVRLTDYPSELDVACPDSSAGSESVNQELRERLERTLESLNPPLPATTRQVIVLRLLGGHSVSDVAHETGLDPKQVRNHQYDGLERLRRTLSIYANAE
jgi:RNA polymerase sigma factor (sigma-70 family)